MRNPSMLLIAPLMVAALVACGDARDAHDHAHAEDDGWGVTSWGDAYEIFAECDPLIAGGTARAYTHVTVLADFSPLRSGAVSFVLRSADGTETVFAQDKPTRDGIFSVGVAPPSAGDFDLVFRVDGPAGKEDVTSGRVRVGTASEPGGRIEDHASHDHAHGESDHTHGEPAGHAHAGETVSFLKEQQWRTEFRTEWAAQRDVSASVRAPAMIRAAAGAEVLLSAPLDGVVSADTRVFVGRDVKRRDVLVSLAPRSSSSVTLAELEAETAVARSRVARLEKLLTLGAVSRAEVEAARARLASLEPRLEAAKGSTAGDLLIRAPFDGRVAETRVTPGTAVSAGDPLIRLVRTPPVWIEAAVAPGDAPLLRGAPSGISLEARGEAPFVIEGPGLRLVSVSPEIDRATGTVTVIFEAAESIPYPLGSLVNAEILLKEKSSGIVVPATAIVDDAGIPVVYVQIEGETFERREVAVVTRQGTVVAVDGVRAGERVVIRGAAAIRRASLLSSGEVEGHVH